MKVREYDLKNQTVLEIGKFAILWNWFENEYCDNNCNFNTLKSAAPVVGMNTQKQKELADAFNERKLRLQLSTEEYVDLALFPPKARRSKQTEQEERKTMEEFIDQRGLDTEIGCLMSIYRIRCNMMHGLKFINELDDQIKLFEAANGVLVSIR